MNQKTSRMKSLDDRRLFDAPPADYFDTLPDQVMHRLEPRRSVTKWREGRRMKRQWVPAIVASFLLGGIVWWWNAHRIEHSDIDDSLRKWTLEDEMLYNWNDEYMLWDEAIQSNHDKIMP